MPFPASTHFILRGVGPGSEIWQTGFWTSYEPTSESDLSTALGVVKTELDTFWGAVKAFAYPTYSATEYRAYSYAGGSTKSQFEQSVTFTAVPGTSATSGSPIDTCLVISLRTDFVGRSKRGRMYLPFHGNASSTGMVSNSFATDIAQAAATLLSAVNADGFGPVTVVSQALGTQEPVTSVVVDNKPDVQRRRENRLAPSFSQAEPVTPPA